MNDNLARIAFITLVVNLLYLSICKINRCILLSASNRRNASMHIGGLFKDIYKLNQLLGTNAFPFRHGSSTRAF